MRLLSLIILTQIVSSFQCNKCVDVNDQILDNSRQWLPLKGKSQLKFSNQVGQVDSFNLSVIDTTTTSHACAGAPFQYEFIRGRLMLNNSGSDFIGFALDQINIFCVNTTEENITQISQCDILKKAGTISEVVRLFNININGTIYSESILIKSKISNTKIDSIFLTKDKGITSFKYKGLVYNIL